jgi:hypothetical protein
VTTGQLANPRLPDDINVSGTVNANVAITTLGNVTASSAVGQGFFGNGYNLGQLVAGNVTSGQLNNARMPTSISVSAITANTTLNVMGQAFLWSDVTMSANVLMNPGQQLRLTNGTSQYLTSYNQNSLQIVSYGNSNSGNVTFVSNTTTVGAFVFDGLVVTGNTSVSKNLTVTANVGIGSEGETGSRVQLGTKTAASTASVERLSLGGTYSNSAGQNPKVLLHEASLTYGLGVSLNQQDYMVPTGASHVFYTNAAEKMRLDASGLLGIGCTPTRVLSVSGGNWGFQEDNVDRGIIWGTGGSASKSSIGGNASTLGYLTFGVTNTERMRIDRNGNVGINTANPVHRLSVSGTSYLNGAVSVQGGSNTAPAGISFAGSDPGVMIEKRYAANDRYGIGQYELGTTRVYAASSYSQATVRLCFPTSETAFTDVLTATKFGNVGIANASPVHTLAVSGTAYVSGNLTLGGRLSQANVHTVAGLTADQAIPASDTTLTMTDKSDPNSWWDAVNYRFSPTVAGYYFCRLQVNWKAGSGSGVQCNIQILNQAGTAQSLAQIAVPTSVTQSLDTTAIVYLDGTASTWVRCTGNSSSATTHYITGNADQNWTHFTAFKIS